MSGVSRFGKLLAGILLGAALVTGLIAVRPLYSQSSPVSATVDKTDLTDNDVLTLKVTIDDQTNVSLPILPVIDGLEIIGRRANTTRNHRSGAFYGAFTATFEFIYEFRPTRLGAIEIGPVTVRVENNEYLTQPITVNVTQGAPRPQAQISPTPDNDAVSPLAREFGQGSFSEAKVDNDRPYLGQQITYSLRFYAANSPYTPTYRAPDFAGFWNAGRRPDTNSTEEVNGRDYLVTKVDTVLFPNLAGDITIEPGVMLLPGRFYQEGRREFQTNPVEISVRPLPANEPPGYTGAVGRYAISARVDAGSVVMGDPLVMSVEISGVGNLNTLPDPLWPKVAGMRAYDGDTSVETSFTDGMWIGMKTFERVLVPDVAGTFELPSIEYAYFDPELERYATARSEPIRLEVVPDAGGSTSQRGLVDASDSGDSTIVFDIAHIKPPPGAIAATSGSVTSNRLYWAGWLAPVLGVLAAATWIAAARKRKRTAISEAGRSETAGALALSRLSDLGAGASSADAAHAALHGYLTAVLGRQTATVPASDVSAMVEARGSDSATAQRLEATLTTLDRMRFSPSGVIEGENAIHDVAEIVQQLTRELSR